MKELILNADDFGLTRGVNEAIIRAHREGVLTSATLMANGEAFDDAIAAARANPRLGVGCHLVLVGGTSVADAREIPSLADGAGRLPRTLGALIARVSCGRIRSEEIERELAAQVRKIREAGLEPTHLDTHKHAHAHPVILEAVGRLANASGIRRVRKPLERVADSWRTARPNGDGFARQFLGSVAMCAAAPRFRAAARKYGLRSPDHFFGLAATGHLDDSLLRGIIDTLPEGRTEIMTHPGICDADLARTGSRLQGQRERELGALLHPAVKRAVAEGGIKLICYRELN
ncbi:MAG TPA: ChbG/HpnK family deacetylase [Candidatus Acidoferrales bacterium]|nr:ChbG/HpnK family deacetylase [Candidatus Acidoferrales bacterium]